MKLPIWRFPLVPGSAYHGRRYQSTSYARTSLRRAKNEKTSEICGLLDPTKSEGITRNMV